MPGYGPIFNAGVIRREGVFHLFARGVRDGYRQNYGPGPRFLDYVYANSMSTLAIGRARYGIMLREDGMLMDDGTVARFGPEHFVLTTTTANSPAVLEHMEFQLQAVCPHLDVRITDVGDQWAQFAVAGPNARAVVASVVEGLDMENAPFPFPPVPRPGRPLNHPTVPAAVRKWADVIALRQSGIGSGS